MKNVEWHHHRAPSEIECIDWKHQSLLANTALFGVDLGILTKVKSIETRHATNYHRCGRIKEVRSAEDPRELPNPETNK